MRLTVDGKQEEFWLAAALGDPVEKLMATAPNLKRTVEGKGRTVAVTLRPDSLDLGVDVFLEQFQRTLDAGTSNASQYSSRIDLLDRQTGKPIAIGLRSLSNLMVAMNQPVDFTDPTTSRTYRLFQSNYRGPWSPEQVKLEPKDAEEDLIYVSYLTVASDPGRVPKYLGSVMLLIGIFVRYFVRIGPKAAVFGLLLFGMSGSAHAAEAGKLDWHAWQQLPVIDNGRVMPLDTFARLNVKQICGTQQPHLDVASGKAGSPTDRRRYDASELLFAWLAEPERWEHVAFLRADDPDLRRELLEVPVFDENGQRLQYVSPKQVAARRRGSAIGSSSLPSGKTTPRKAVRHRNPRTSIRKSNSFIARIRSIGN